jgi:predicted nucleotidyltransferase
MLSSSFESRRDAAVEHLLALVQSDERLVALWLQGSLADGTADPLSDIDAYIAVRDGDFDEVYSARMDLIGRVAPVLISTEDPALHMINCLLEGPVKLDLFLTKESQAPEVERPAVRMLVDKVGLGPRLRRGWTPPVERAGRMIDSYFRGTFQGGMWPVRLLLRGQLTTFAMTELLLVNDFLVAFMIAQVDPAHLFKNRFSIPRHLPEAKRREVETLGAAVAVAVAARDLPAMRDVHLRIVDAVLREGRAAYASLGLSYPMTGEQEQAIRRIYLDNWPVTLD